MERILNELLDWRMQFQDFKTLILTGSTPRDRIRTFKAFAKKNCENMISVNLKNNEEIREYINTHPAGYDAYLYLEQTLHDVIVPMETILIFDNADSCRFESVRDYANNLFSEEDTCFFAICGDFTPEQLEELGETCVLINLPEKEDA